jgi:hypothetical protein
MSKVENSSGAIAKSPPAISLTPSDRAKQQVIGQVQQALVVVKHLISWTTGIIISSNGCKISTGIQFSHH